MARDAVKHWQANNMDHILMRLDERFAASPLGEILGPHTVLVPAPKSAPLKKDTLWPPLLLCQKLVERGYGRDCQILIERAVAVQKAAYAGPGQRPRISEHRNSLAIRELQEHPETITVVDDIVTKGSTLYACVRDLEAIYPRSRVFAFALIRTMREDVDAVIDPVVGNITSYFDEGLRTP